MRRKLHGQEMTADFFLLIEAAASTPRERGRNDEIGKLKFGLMDVEGTCNFAQKFSPLPDSSSFFIHSISSFLD